MATANKNILNKMVAHEIDVLGYGNSLSKKIIGILNKSDEAIFTKLIKVVDALPDGTVNVRKLDKLIEPIVKINNEAYKKARIELERNMAGFTEQEIDFQVKVINQESAAKIKTIAPEQVYAAALAQPFQGQILSEYFSKLSEQKVSMINNAVRMGLIEGEPTNAIVKVIRGTRQLDYKDGMLAITRRNAEAVVLTSLAHFQNFAQEALYDANADIIKGYRYTATLDTRTTELCASRDGKFFKIGEPKPAIPAHYRCRSRYVPVLKSFRELGLDVDEFPASTRASMDGQVPEKLTYSDWLKNQSFERQVAVLGKTRAKLFIEGNLPIDKFISPTNHLYTLDELKKLNEKEYYLAQSVNSTDLNKLSIKNQKILKDMYEKAALNKNAFDAINKTISSAVDGKLITAKLKGTSRTVEKILSDYNGDPTKVKDLLRTTIEVKSLNDVDALINDITSRYGTPIKLRNSLKIGSPSLNGYRDVNMVIKYNDSLAEVQINISDMLEAKKIYHKEYEVIRKLQAIVQTEKRALTVIEQQKLNDALEKMEKGYNYAWEKAIKDKD